MAQYKTKRDLPRSNVYEKWALIDTQDGPKVAYLTSLFGGGIVPGPANGGRCMFLVNDNEFGEQTTFKQQDLLRTWVNQPTDRILNIALEKLAA